MRHVDSGKIRSCLYKSVRASGYGEGSHNLARIIDTGDRAQSGPRRATKSGEIASTQEKPELSAGGIPVDPDDIASGINAVRFGPKVICRVNKGVITPTQEKPNELGASPELLEGSDDIASGVDVVEDRRMVSAWDVGPVVKLPAVNLNAPLEPVPTTSPALLIP
jgi:hypothetical protein